MEFIFLETTGVFSRFSIRGIKAKTIYTNIYAGREGGDVRGFILHFSSLLFLTDSYVRYYFSSAGVLTASKKKA